MIKLTRKCRVEKQDIFDQGQPLCRWEASTKVLRFASLHLHNLATTGVFLLAATLVGCSGSEVTSGVTASKGLAEAGEHPITAKDDGSITSSSSPESEPAREVVQTTGGLTIASPNGGEKWKAGKAVAIRWTKGRAGGTVKIQLLKSQKHYLWITKKTKNDGAFVWKIPSSVPAGSTYKIKIVSRKRRKIFDKSDKPFTISAATDNFNLSKVTWLHTKVANWPKTSTLKVTIRGGTICLNHKDKNSWPSISIPHTSGSKMVKVNANPWVFVKKDGKWYGGTWEWMATGSVCKPTKSVAGDHIKQSPLHSWRPKSGETLYFMVSALARSGKKNNFAARTNVVKVVWP